MALTQISRRRPHQERLRPVVLAALLLVLVQAAIGMVVNLDVTIPVHHPGAHPSDYLTGSLHSIGWAIGHGAAALVLHALLGLLLLVVAIAVPLHARRLGSPAAVVWTTLAALLVIGAGFNGASFLDFAHAGSSLIMSLLAFGAIACYAVTLFLLAH